ncbi:MAG: CHAD domain-containing protein [Desulfobacterales bacterium]|jgi:CHAD domain-containing protein
MLDNLQFNLPDGYNERRISRILTAHYGIKKEPTIAGRIQLLDTFDWRLFNKSLVLSASGKKLWLRKLTQNNMIHSVDFNTLPIFIGDFPAGELKEFLAPIIKMRALLQLVELHSRSAPYRILNQDEKTVARLAFEEFRMSRNQNAPILISCLRLKAVRGYGKYSQHLAKLFKAAGLTIDKDESLYFKALTAAGNKPGSYSAKMNVQLEPRMPSAEAAKTVLRFLLQVMRINQDYIEKDVDTEFLHDFRVAIRRTRSALGQIKSVFPMQTTNRFKKDFAWMGKLSNQLRDLDVYLLKERTYKAMLPRILREDIEPLFELLRKKRSQALKKVVTSLRTKKYAKILQDWGAFLNQPQQEAVTAANSELPIIDLACKRIYKKYRGVVKAGNRILDNTEDELLHVLRIECKKLRYLMEFFSSLFNRKKIQRLIEQLKKLQDNLGDFNDLRIQEEYLLRISNELPSTRQQENKTLVAIGSLIGTLARERQMVRNAFAKTFKNFASPANQKLFRELFASKV